MRAASSLPNKCLKLCRPPKYVQIFRQKIKQTTTAARPATATGSSSGPGAGPCLYPPAEQAQLHCQIKAHLTFLALHIRLVDGKPKLKITFSCWLRCKRQFDYCLAHSNSSKIGR